VKPRKKQMKHKHAEVIKAWADGAEIQSKHFPLETWITTPSPDWFLFYQYRVKPTPKPDIVQERFVSLKVNPDYRVSTQENLKLTFDGETGTLKSAEVI
jgi:hypothetical protein